MFKNIVNFINRKSFVILLSIEIVPNWSEWDYIIKKKWFLVNKTDKITIIFYIFLASSFGFYIMTYVHECPLSATACEDLNVSMIESVTPKKIIEFETSRLVDVPNNRIFNVMADIENFPNILPENVVFVTIAHKTER